MSQGRGTDMSIALAVIGILVVILVPLPPLLMDSLLILNLTVSLMVLLAAVYAATPMEVSVFPSLLLVVTFFRLALNVATTRLILGNGEQGAAAAGKVVQAFGSFVAGNNVVVGFIVFAIIVVVQFVVITKGSTRISEVAARFTLDALPGKQLSIDGDLSSGFIDRSTARGERRQLSDQADFYGTMDGASKFVRGEAIAGLVITSVNIVGGLCIGVIYHGMQVAEAAEVFTRLTIGDGLVTQVPALMVSVGAALLVTKGTGGSGLARDLGRQLFASDRVFLVAAGFLAFLFLLGSGLPRVPLLGAIVVCGGAGLALRRRARRTEGEEEGSGEPAGEPDESAGAARAAESAEDRARSLLAVEPLELQLGYRLIGFVDEARGGDLMTRLGKVRERVAVDLGFVVPPVRVRDNIRLHATEYSIKLRGNGMGVWRVWPGRFFVSSSREALEGIQGVEGKDPSTGESGLWVEENQGSLVASSGWRVRRPEEIVASHLEALVRARAAEILTREEVSRLLADLHERAPALVEELVPGTLKLGEVHKVLQNLLRERVSIRDLETILEALADHSESSRDPAVLTEHVRRALSRSICGALASPDGVLYASLLDPALEEFLQTSLEDTDQGARLVLEPEVARTLVEGAMESFARLSSAGRPPLLVCSRTLRAHVRKLIGKSAPDAAVLSYEEVSGDDFRLEVHESVALENVR